MIKKIKSNNHFVFVGDDCNKELKLFLKQNKYSQIFILCDENTMKFCLPQLIHTNEVLSKAEIIEVDSGEINKNIETTVLCWQTLTELEADKNSLLINVGGGMISDLGGFIASTYKRGIDFINIPTTVLGMADASVGGKNGIDFLHFKNQIGTITQPKAIFCSTHFLATLPKRHVDNGFAEIIKIAIIADKNLFKEICIAGEFNTENWTKIIIRAIELKNNIVKKDPTEKNIRKLLNFGHTIGHAIESYLMDKKDLLHGEAIATGMYYETKLAHQLKLITSDEREIIEIILNKYYKIESFTASEIGEITAIAKHDKKNKGNRINFSLPNGIGKGKINVEITEAKFKTLFNK